MKATRTQDAGDALIYYGRRYHRVGERSVQATHQVAANQGEASVCAR
ncbi:hypothetical protein VSR82_35330 [Burkholderia sp. JPY481]